MHGTSPKQYVLIESDIEVIDMIEQSYVSKKVDVVITVEDDILDSSQISCNMACTTTSTLAACDEQFLSGQIIEARVLFIGAHFQDSSSFKQALRTGAITNNFGVKFKSSNKTRVIAICSHRDCPWRIRASLCADGESFEVRRLEGRHTCPGVNRAGNILATSSWVTQEIQDIMKTQPDIPIKQIKNNLEMSYGLSLPHMNNHNTNNMAESFNAWIGDARAKPVIDLIDIIRAIIMEQRAERKLHSAGWQSELVPHVDEYIREVTTRKEHFIVRASLENRAEVQSCSEREEVDIQYRECSCRYWQLIGLPCIHAAALIGSKEHPLWHTYVDEHYYSSRYRLAYDGAIATLPGKELWKVVDDGAHIDRPNSLRPRGRPKKTIFKIFLEGGTSNSRNVHNVVSVAFGVITRALAKILLLNLHRTLI